MAAQTVPAVGTPRPALPFAELNVCAPASPVPVLYFGMRGTLLRQVFRSARGSFRRQVTSVRVTESWRPQLGLAGPLSRVDTDALVPLGRPAGRLWSHATAEHLLRQGDKRGSAGMKNQY